MNGQTHKTSKGSHEGCWCKRKGVLHAASNCQMLSGCALGSAEGIRKMEPRPMPWSRRAIPGTRTQSAAHGTELWALGCNQVWMQYSHSTPLALFEISLVHPSTRDALEGREPQMWP